MSIIDTCSIQCWLFIELFHSNLEKTCHFLSCFVIWWIRFSLGGDQVISTLKVKNSKTQAVTMTPLWLLYLIKGVRTSKIKPQTLRNSHDFRYSTRYIKRLFSPNKNMARFDVEVLQQTGAFGLLHHCPSPHRQRGESTEVDGISYGKWDLFPSRRKTLRGETTTEQMFWADFVCLKY